MIDASAAGDRLFADDIGLRIRLVMGGGGVGIDGGGEFLSSGQEADTVVDGPFGKMMLAKLDAKNIHGLAYWELGFRNMTNRDLKRFGCHARLGHAASDWSIQYRSLDGRFAARAFIAAT